MAKKKQSRVVAGQNKARERARRKAHYSGPAAAPATVVPAADEADDASAETPNATDTGSAALAVATSQTADAMRTGRAAPTVTQRRRATQAMTVASGPSLRSETLRIGIVTAVVLAVLVSLKLGTTLGA